MLKDFWSAWKTRKDNPLVRYGTPRRRGVFVAFLYYLTLLFFAAGLLVFTIGVFVPGGGGRDLLEPYLVYAAVYAPLAIPVTTLFFIPRWRTTDRLTELALSRMRGSEIAFGMLYWGVATSLQLTMGVLLMLWGILLFFESNWNSYNPSPLELSYMIVALCLLAHATTIRHWLRSPSRPWSVVFYAPIRMFLPSFVILIFWLTLIDTLTEPYYYVSPSFRHSTLWYLVRYGIFGTVFFAGVLTMTIWLFRTAISRAGSCILAHARIQDFLEADWTKATLAIRNIPREKRRFPLRFFRDMKLRFCISFITQLSFALACLLLFFLLIRNINNHDKWLGFIVLSLAIAPLSAILGLISQTKWKWRSALPLVGGSMGISTLSHSMVTPLVLGAIGTFILYAEGTWGGSRWARLVAPIIFGFALSFAFLLVSLLTTAMVLPRYRRISVILFLGILSLLTTCAVFYGITTQQEEWMGIPVFIQCSVYVLLLEHAFDRLHWHELSKVPIMTITTEWAEPEPPLEPIPDGYFKI